MIDMPQAAARARPVAAWLAAALAGAAAPAAAMLLVMPHAPAPLIALGMMGSGMIGAAAAGSLRHGLALGVLSGLGLLALAARGGALMPLANLPGGALAVLVASLSFAVRGALFARSAGARGWWIALAVVAGEAALLLTALARPAAVPAWLLCLLPAQWTSAAIGAPLGGMAPAISELLALAGTAAATALVARLWPRRWPYLVMFTVWLTLSALVWHRPAPDPSAAGRPESLENPASRPLRAQAGELLAGG